MPPFLQVSAAQLEATDDKVFVSELDSILDSIFFFISSQLECENGLKINNMVLKKLIMKFNDFIKKLIQI